MCQWVIETRAIPDVAPMRLHISRHYGCPFPCASRTEDGRLVAAGLLARGSNVSSSLPGTPTRSASGVFGGDLPPTVAGAATGLTQGASHRVPSSSPYALAHGDTVTPLKRRISIRLSTQIGGSRRRHSAARYRSATPARAFEDAFRFENGASGGVIRLRDAR